MGKGRARQRGSAIIFVLFMVLATAFIVAVAATFGRQTTDIEYRYERDRAVQRAWDAAVSEADAKSAAGSLSSLPATFSISLNGVTGTVTVSSNSANLANSLLVTSTLTASDGTTYAESSIIAQSSSGSYLNGNYWYTNASSIASCANAWTWMMANPTPTGTFNGQLLNYSGMNTTDVETWLSTDSPSFTGTNDDFYDGVVQFYGYITIPTKNTVLQLTSYDGAYLSVDGDNWVISNVTATSQVTGTVTIPTAGTYPLYLTYYKHYQGGNKAGLCQLYWNTGTGIYSAIPTTDIKPLSQTWVRNGSATSYGNGNCLVNGVTNEAGSAWMSSAQTVSSFHCSFDFEFANCTANGITFCIQNTGTSALGADSTGLGFQGINKSVAVTFDAYNSSETNVYTNGASPAAGGTTLWNDQIWLPTGDLLHCALVYNGTTLTETVTDPTKGYVFTATYTVNIPSIVGANTAYVGFTGSTGPWSTQAWVTNLNFGP